MSRIFLLSPAHCGGRRAQMVLRRQARFDLALRLRDKGVPLGELFTFLSGLYFRGKMAYATAFADPPPSCPGVLVITPCRGLLPPETRISAADLRIFAATEIGEDIEAYIRPLSRDARRLARRAGPETEIILLGSIATGKYLNVLLKCFGSRLRFPRDFVARGDMSRGGLLLRRAEDREELEYIPAEGAVLHGTKPPKLAPRRYLDR
ncbi:MAG: hypothetical protein EHM31_10345 [Candidatus Aminicenantes bacterium]|nr:MAG: hypothetical protein EHM31_10345 [Candidatus Aminicenantes bacterium]